LDDVPRVSAAGAKNGVTSALIPRHHLCWRQLLQSCCDCSRSMTRQTSSGDFYCWCSSVISSMLSCCLAGTVCALLLTCWLANRQCHAVNQQTRVSCTFLVGHFNDSGRYPMLIHSGQPRNPTSLRLPSSIDLLATCCCCPRIRAEHIVVATPSQARFLHISIPISVSCHSVFCSFSWHASVERLSRIGVIVSALFSHGKSFSRDALQADFRADWNRHYHSHGISQLHIVYQREARV
jgi:hypothetical protein